MSNIKSLSDMKKGGGGGGGHGGPPGGGGMPPNGGGGGGFGIPGLGNLFGGGAPGGGHGGDDGKNIIHIHNDRQFKDELAKAGGKLVVVDFTASWCGPCKMIAPVFKELSEKYTNVAFLKVDVDECQDTARECGVRSMPTFQFYKGRSKVDEFSGANPDKLRATIEKHQTAAPVSSGGFTLGSAPTPAPMDTSGASEPATSNNSLTAEAREARLRRLNGGAAPVASTEGGANAGPRVIEASDMASAEDMNLVFLATLVEFGFPEDLAKRALKATGAKDIESATDWCIAHAEDAAKGDQSAASGGDATSQSTSTSTSAVDDPSEDMELDIGEKKGPKWDDRHLTPEELAIEKQKLNEKLEQIRKKKAEDEAKAAIEREKMRVQGGKQAQENKKKFEEDQRKRDEFLKKKQAEEERVAKARIKAKIEQDKAERAAAAAKAREGATSQPVASAPAPVAAQSAPTKKEYTECAIQIRMPDGNSIKASFKPTDTVRTVHDHVALLTGSERFALTTTFPRKVYSPKDNAMNTTTLAQAELVPNGTFVVQNI